MIRTLTIYGDSLKKLYKVLPQNCIKTIPVTESNVPKHNLEVYVNGVLFTGEDDDIRVIINSSNRDYSKEELTDFQKLAIKCYTYPFGALEFILRLNIRNNDENEKVIRNLLTKYKMDRSIVSLDSEGYIELSISDVKDFSASSFIDFILELQTITYLLGE